MNKFKYLLFVLSLHMTAFTMDDRLNNPGESDLVELGDILPHEFGPDQLDTSLEPGLDDKDELYDDEDELYDDLFGLGNNFPSQSNHLLSQPEVPVSDPYWTSASLPPAYDEVATLDELPPVQPTSLLLPPPSNSHNWTLAPVQSSHPEVAVSTPLPHVLAAAATTADEDDEVNSSEKFPLRKRKRGYDDDDWSVRSPARKRRKTTADPVQPVVPAPHHLPSVQPAVAVSVPLPPAYQAVAASAPLPPVLAAAATAANDLVQSHTCSVCSKSFQSKSKLITHERTHTGERPFQCDICKKSFTQKGNLTKHKERHTGERSYQCETCGQCFTQKANLKTHVKIHTEERSFVCDTCGQSFRRKAHLNIHKRGKHPEEEFAASTPADSSTVVPAPLPAQPAVAISAPYWTYAPLPAQLAVAVFAPLAVQSEVAASAPLPFAYQAVAAFDELPPAYQAVATSAPLPPALAATATAANDLVKSHICPVCSKSFQYRSYLERHTEREHIRKRPFKCETCGKSFIENSNLIRHVREHTGERPHQCETCGKSFREKHHLIRHVQKHTGERPYICNYDGCRYSYERLGDLNNHKKQMHPEEEFAASTPADSLTVVPAPLPPNVPFDELPAAQPEVAASPPLPPTLSFTNGADQVSDDNDDESI